MKSVTDSLRLGIRHMTVSTTSVNAAGNLREATPNSITIIIVHKRENKEKC